MQGYTPWARVYHGTRGIPWARVYHGLGYTMYKLYHTRTGYVLRARVIHQGLGYTVCWGIPRARVYHVQTTHHTRTGYVLRARVYHGLGYTMD